jgi:dTDP-L-rhamnose 4-epimerase
MDMAEVLAAAMNGPTPAVTGTWRTGDVRHVAASPARASRTLGFTATVRFTPGMADFATAPLRD